VSFRIDADLLEYLDSRVQNRVKSGVPKWNRSKEINSLIRRQQIADLPAEQRARLEAAVLGDVSVEEEGGEE